ncbi:MAG: response regulator [Anaerolineaceae bacterium]|nr:response regulator [Anaerolineaceae bacterium]
MSSKTILLVEDNASDVDLTLRAFERAQIQAKLIVAEDGQQALDILLGNVQQNGGRDLPTLVLMDVNLPKIDGFEVLKAIRGNVFTHNLPVVFLTSSTEEKDMKQATILGLTATFASQLIFINFHQSFKAWATIGCL